ncbi:post-AAA+ oligomerization domain-like protein [Ranid herpesvirus 3]|uniref:Post-AAA+ oligomerization domain-like protein n=1 Tax=Ranid herpesvirus 3 TaxID=1987509 RepID=A0A1X9T5F1_9VIRU|nr:post-AAA+ oligomerization domain-like protein [Ranid herpesvirus 3]ARR28875.1 post-AAA+ oligomerization domain-like protein [Ranid herpesvirus 3]
MLKSEAFVFAFYFLQLICEEYYNGGMFLHARSTEIQASLRDGIQQHLNVWQKVNVASPLLPVPSYLAGVRLYESIYEDKCPDSSTDVIVHLEWYIAKFGNKGVRAKALRKFVANTLGSPLVPYVLARFTIDPHTPGNIAESPLKHQLSALLHPFNGLSVGV